MAEWNGRLAVDIRDAVPDWGPFVQPKAPDGAPNVLMIVWDDVGYGAWDVSGGPIEVPTMRRIRDLGVHYANFHTTALCSPTRASLLTGRNATSNGMACIAEATSGFPSSSGRIPFENGLISEVLGERGWNTYCVGKWHLTPEEESDLSSWRKRWPLGRGFERFYGFLGGETSQWYPELIHDNHPVEPPSLPEDGYHLSKDLADRAIQFIQDAKAAAPSKPFFMYLAPGAGHAPHHVPAEWADRYKGRFDMGYEAIRAGILEQQKAMGLLPEDTILSALNPHGEPDATGPKGQAWPMLDFVRPWDSLTEDERRLFARMAEVFAGFVSYTDAEIGRVLDHLEATGELDNTIIVVVSDNGSSAEGGPNGAFNAQKFFNGIADTVEAAFPRLDELGSPSSYNHFCTGWAWAFDTPFPYWKRYAGYEGGTADLCLVAWPAGIHERGVIRQQYVHAVDVVPTIYDLLDMTPPATLNGYPQHPLEGESFVPSITDADAPGRSTQFYAMLGQRAIYHEGWLANTLHPTISGWGSFDADQWELYDLAHDRSQSTDVAAQHPERLRELIDQWWYWAGVYNALPLDDRLPIEILMSPRPQPAEPSDRYRYYPGASPIPEAVAVNLRGRSYTIAAGVVVENQPDGILFQQGTLLGGHVLYLDNGTLHYTYNWLGDDVQRISGPAETSPGRHLYAAAFAAEGHADNNPSTIGTLTLYVDETPVASAHITTQPGRFGTGGGLCVGRGIDPSPDPQRPAPGTFTGGQVEGVVVDVSGDPYLDHDLEVQAWLSRD